MQHDLKFKNGQWELRIFGLHGRSASELVFDVKPLELCLQLGVGNTPSLQVKLPEHAAIDVDQCAAPEFRRRDGILIFTWPPVHRNYVRECILQTVSESPLILVCEDFLDQTECTSIVDIAQRTGKRTTGASDYELKMDMDPNPLGLQSLSQNEQMLLESVYSRIDAICGVERHKHEQMPRVHNYGTRVVRPGASARSDRMPLGLHVDTNGRPYRYVTAIVYLTTVAGDGATVFPCVADTAAARAGQELLKGGTKHSKNLSDPDHAPLANELLEAAETRRGLSVGPRAGKMVVFFSRLPNGQADGTSWHGGARVESGSSASKWILQLFKEVPAAARGDHSTMARFIASRRSVPNFTLHGVRHLVIPDLSCA